MLRNILTVFVLVLAIIFAAAPARAENWYFGGGLDFAGVESAQPFLTDQNGFGLILNGGYRFTENISLDVAISSLALEDTGGADITYSIFSIGPKIDFMSVYNNGWSPWVLFSLTSHALSWDRFFDEVEGTGISFALGADFRVTYSGVIQVALRTHSFDGEWNFNGVDYDTDTSELTVSYIWHMWQ
ncbi:MAG: outer membrane beta-barrel protein [bacterium]